MVPSVHLSVWTFFFFLKKQGMIPPGLFQQCLVSVMHLTVWTADVHCEDIPQVFFGYFMTTVSFYLLFA